MFGPCTGGWRGFDYFDYMLYVVCAHHIHCFLSRRHNKRQEQEGSLGCSAALTSRDERVTKAAQAPSPKPKSQYKYRFFIYNFQQRARTYRCSALSKQQKRVSSISLSPSSQLAARRPLLAARWCVLAGVVGSWLSRSSRGSARVRALDARRWRAGRTGRASAGAGAQVRSTQQRQQAQAAPRLLRTHTRLSPRPHRPEPQPACGLSVPHGQSHILK
jgi:hypothetical protein